MDIIIHDLTATLKPMFLSRRSPRERLAEAQRTIFAPGGVLNAMPAGISKSGAFQVMANGLQDGYDVVAARQVWGLFNPARSHAASEWQFARYHETDLASLAMEAIVEANHGLPEVLCYIVPGDPGNRNFMMNNLGVSAFAYFPNVIIASIWPSKRNVAKFPRLIHRMLFHLASGEPHTLGDFIMREAQVPRDFDGIEEWRISLMELARICGIENATELPSNTYGMREMFGDLSGFWSELAPLTEEESKYAADMILTAWDERDPAVIAAHLFGDSIVGAHGLETVGLPPFAGFRLPPTLGLRSPKKLPSVSIRRHA